MTLVISIFLFAGCGNTPSPKKVTEDFFKDIKAGTSSKIGKEVLKHELAGKDIPPEIVSAVFDAISKMESEVVGETIDGDNATVDVKIKGVNFKKVIGTSFKKLIPYAITSGNVSKEEKNKKMEEVFLQSLKEAPVEEKTGKINLTKEKDGWVVSKDENLLKVVFGVSKEDIDKLIK